MTVIGCDVGTQSTKGVLVSERGDIVSTASARHAVEFPAAGWAQQDSQEWLSAVRTVVSTLAAESPQPVRCVGVSAQVDGVVATDDRLQPLHPALIWMDRRSAASAVAVGQRLGLDEIFAVTGLNCDGSHGGPKMRWLLDYLTETPAHLLPPATIVTSWLTGNVAQDHANASSSMLYDVTSRSWSPMMTEAFGIDPETLPKIVDATDGIGSVRPALADDLGLSRDCLVVAGTGDDHAAAVGAGAVRPGIVVDVTGTAEPIGTTSDQAVFDTERLVETHAHAVSGSFFIENPGFVSGGSVLWVSRLLNIDQGEVLARADRAPAGARGLVFIPALSGSMTPRWNDRARGSFSGVTMEHDSDHWCRAVLEGCVFAMRDVVDRIEKMGLGVDECRVTGGGARSPVWLQMKADVTGRPVRAVEGEGSALGAACLAAVAAGWFPDLPSATDDLVNVDGAVFEPQASNAEAYAGAYSKYRAVFDALEPLWDRP